MLNTEIFEDYFSSLSSVSLLTSFLASLNSFIPFPRPLINSGIFFPPNNNKIAAAAKAIYQGPIANNTDFIYFNF